MLEGVPASRVQLLQWAAEDGDVEEVGRLLSASNVNHCDPDYGCSLLNLAAGRGNAGVVGLLLAKGAQPDVGDVEGFTALHRAVWGGYLDVVKLLCEAGADVKAKGRLKAGSVLCLACRRSEIEIVRYLLQFTRSSIINDIDSTGTTPLCSTIIAANLDLTRLLVSHGASTTLNDPFHLCHTSALHSKTKDQQLTFRSILALLSQHNSQQSIVGVR
eukprot:TRINITY_DN20737_c0_g1_i2.p1 TRINITY_DN20737_c0_g1~~TRINITY_DN20737_c0_g1_i2.p1  ORF type:complete len:216 (+),score=28.00 TRINITY_DN20737_c0_g1_i2:45-692(+)